MISARPPKAAAGRPPPITLPNVIRSPGTPSRPYQPDLVTRKPVSTSSMISSEPYSRPSAASSSLKPRAGGTTPMFAGQAERGNPRPGGGQQGVDVPVVAAGELHHQPAAGEATRQPDRGHGGLGAGVDQPHLLHRGPRHDLLGE